MEHSCDRYRYGILVEIFICTSVAGAVYIIYLIF